MEKTARTGGINPQAQEFLENLRAATNPIHKKLEALPLSSLLLKPGVSLDNYARYLSCMKEVVMFYDQVILPSVSGIISNTAARGKLAAITNDLNYLKQLGINPKPVLPLLTPVVDINAALGLAYVIEGSTLGSRVILKHIKDQLELTESHGATFFGGYQASTGAMWTLFLNDLTTYAAGHESEQIIKGAVDGFTMIFDHFSKNAPLQ